MIYRGKWDDRSEHPEHPVTRILRTWFCALAAFRNARSGYLTPYPKSRAISGAWSAPKIRKVLKSSSKADHFFSNTCEIAGS
jgi:hypothetical protein